MARITPRSLWWAISSPPPSSRRATATAGPMSSIRLQQRQVAALSSCSASLRMRRAVPTELQNESGTSDVYIEVRSCASSARVEHTTAVSCINWHIALFLDCDGVIHVDRGYIHRSEFVP